MRSLKIGVVCAAFAALASGQAQAVLITNGLSTSTVGYLAVDVVGGGQSHSGNITAVGTPSGTTFVNTPVIFDYHTFIDVGPLGGAFRLSESGASLMSGSVVSSGSFAGQVGNTINWSVSSSIPSGGDTMTSSFTFSTQTGTLGAIRFYQYLDEDVLGFSNDVFFTRGTAAGGDLELFTVDNAQAVGVSHSGALNTTQGLDDAIFSGWAACIFNNMQPRITAGTQLVNPTGSICAELATVPINHPVVGPGFGPRDIVSVLAWDVNPLATSATVITTFGGVARASEIPPQQVPEPLSLALVGLGLAGLALSRRRKAA